VRHKFKGHKDSGVAAVELAILLPVFALLIFGILEFGHAWYIKQTITSASREGARYGIVYRTVTGSDGVIRRADPLTEITPSIAGVIDTYLSQFLPAGSWTVPTPTLTTGTGTSIPEAGNELTVTVTTTKTWPLLQLIGMEDIDISATTTMKLE
jgi:Flp pilus assembly protein TadG